MSRRTVGQPQSCEADLRRVKHTISIIRTLGAFGFQFSFVEIDFIIMSQGLHSQESESKKGEEASAVEHHVILFCRKKIGLK